MEITTTYPKQQTSIKRTSSDEQKASAAKGAAESQATGPDADKQSLAATDTINLSAESLNLAKSAEGSNDGAAIGNRQQAEKAVEKLVADIRNNAQLALAAYSNESTDRLKALLS